MATAVKKRTSKGKKRSDKERGHEEDELGAPPDISDLTLENLGQPSNLELVTDKVVTESLTDNPTDKQLECEDNTGIIQEESHQDDTSHVAHNLCVEEIIQKDIVTDAVPEIELREDVPMEIDDDDDPDIQEDVMGNVTSEGALYPDVSQMQVTEEANATAPIKEVAAEVLQDPTIQEGTKENVTLECALYPNVSQMELKEEMVVTAAIIKIAADALENPTIQEDSKDNVTSESTLYPDVSQMELKEEMIVTAAIIKIAADVLENPTIQEGSKDNDISEGTLYPDISKVELKEEVMPTAPIVEEAAIMPQSPTIVKADEIDDILKIGTLKCIPLSQAENLFCGKEIELVKHISRQEEGLVEKSLFSNTDHPLLELLSTFRSSLIGLEKERINLSQKSVEEELYRESLWRVKKMTKTINSICRCGLSVSTTVKYDNATLVVNKVPIGIMRLKSLFHDVQESYCHYQYTVFLAHRQIEGMIQEITLKSNSQIRVILNYLFHTLRNTDATLNIYAECLKRWASALIPYMLKFGHTSDLLYVWHHLFRQNRSVSWAADIMEIRVGDFIELARAIALLDLLFETAYIQLDLAAECVEEGDDVWEEVDQSGAGSSVAAGVLRESDILALLRCFPLRDIVARLVLIRHQKIDGVIEGEWGDRTGGRAVLKSIYGTRVLLSVLQKGLNAHPHYKQLAEAIVELAIQSVCALADLHTYVRSSYSPDLIPQIYGELEAVFSALWAITTSTKLCIEQIPLSILTPRVSRDCFVALSSNLHAETATQVECTMNIEIPSDLACNLKLLIIAQIAVQSDDRRFANTILKYLMQESFTRQITPCPNNCQETARKSLHPILEKHHYLFTDAICAFSLVVFDDFVQSSDIDFLSLGIWRPSPAEVTRVLVTLAQSNLALVPVLLDALDYTPNIGICHDTQLAIGTFLCQRVVESQLPPAEWYWSVLRKMHLHMMEWKGYADINIVTPDETPNHLFVKMFTLLTSAWGHSLPLICEYGVKVLLELAKAGRTRESVYCLSYVMRIMAQSPESVGLTPMFVEICNALMTSTPTLMQRAFGRGGNSGSLLLTKLIISQLYANRRFEDDIMQLLSAWIHMCREHPTLVETALVCCHDYVELNHHMEELLEDESLFSTLSPSPATSPTLCLYMLRVEHSKRELRTGLWQKLLCELDVDRNAGHKPNVDRALNRCDVTFTSDALVIHKMATAALTVPRTHPAHIKLWDWFFCLYMQKPINKPHGLPMGPMFFSGLLKSRTVALLKRHVQDAALYHWTDVKRLELEVSKTQVEVSKTQVEVPKTPEDATQISMTLTPRDIGNADFLPALSLHHLVGDTERARASMQWNSVTQITPAATPPPTTHGIYIQDLKSYHLNAHRLFRSYLKCLEANEKGSVSHNVHFERQQVMLVWKNYLKSITPPSSEDDKYVIRAPTAGDMILPVPNTSLSPLERLKARLRNYCAERRPALNVVNLKPTLRHNPCGNTALIELITDHLNYIASLANDWETETKTIETLDEELWKLVRKLYVSRELSPVRRACSNKHEPVILSVLESDWSISDEVRRGIQKNRLIAVAKMRKIAEPRPKVADIIAALHRATGLVTNTTTALDVLRIAWRFATEAVNLCPPARNAIVTVVTDMAQEFTCKEGIRTSELLREWCRLEQGDLRRDLLKVLVDPQKLSSMHFVIVYRTLLRVALPPDVRFSFISKFDVLTWDKFTKPPGRVEMIHIITQAMSTYGIDPGPPNTVLYELLCVHLCIVIDSENMLGLLKCCARFASMKKFPVTAWTHINKVLETKPLIVPYKRILTTLPELTEMWVHGSVGINQKPELQEAYIRYGKEYIETLRQLTMLSIKSFNDISDIPVEQFMRDLLSNGLIPSILPWFTADEKRLSNPIVTQQEHVKYTTEMFVKILNEICDFMPNVTTHVLQNAFSWVSYVAPNMDPWPRSSLLLQMQSLPWSEPYFSAHYVLYAIMLCCLEEDAKAFIRKAIERVPAASYLAGIDPGHIQNYLGIWLMGFTEDCVAAEFLDVAEGFPWHEMSAQTIHMYLQRYFNNREDPALNDIRVMYKKALKEHWLERPAQREITRSLLHLRPGFKILKTVSLMDRTNQHVSEHTKRVAFIKHWVRSVININTDAEYKASTKALLEAVTSIYQMTKTCREVHEILRHVVALLNIETDTTPFGIPVWREWLDSAPREVVEACVQAVPSVVSFKNHADVGDAALKAFLRFECNDWRRVYDHWEGCVYRDQVALIRRGALLAAYVHSSHPTCGMHTLGAAVNALSTSTINIVQNEAAVALWMCHMTRRVYRSERPCAPPCHEQQEVINASIALLQSWAEERRLNILRTFTRSVDMEAPTPYLRLIARLALCLLTPSEAAVKMYENSHASVIRSTSALADTKHFAKDVKPITLPKLAKRLYPSYERYFTLEFEVMLKQ